MVWGKFPVLSVQRERKGNRQGSLQRFPLLSVSVGGVTTSTRTFAHFGEVVSVASEMKLVAKRTAGSSYAFDRRTT